MTYDRDGSWREERRAREDRNRKGSRTQLDDTLGQHCKLAIESAAAELGVDPLVLARRLNQGEIARLAHLLNAALRHVHTPGLRHRIEDLLTAVTEGVMPAAAPESELDWALRVAKHRRQKDTGADDDG